VVLALLNGNPLFLKNRSWLLKMASRVFQVSYLHIGRIFALFTLLQALVHGC
jgi:hypothetical protein